MNEHRQSIADERDRLQSEMDSLYKSNGTLAELRVIRRKIENLEHQLLWIDRAPRGWFQ